MANGLDEVGHLLGAFGLSFSRSLPAFLGETAILSDPIILRMAHDPHQEQQFDPWAAHSQQGGIQRTQDYDTRFKAAAVQYHFPSSDPVCMFTSAKFPAAGHVIPFRVNITQLTFGKLDKDFQHSARNSLLLRKDLEEAYDQRRFSIVFFEELGTFCAFIWDPSFTVLPHLQPLHYCDPTRVSKTALAYHSWSCFKKAKQQWKTHWQKLVGPAKKIPFPFVATPTKVPSKLALCYAYNGEIPTATPRLVSYVSAGIVTTCHSVAGSPTREFPLSRLWTNGTASNQFLHALVDSFS
jgi:hypothetical protein